GDCRECAGHNNPLSCDGPGAGGRASRDLAQSRGSFAHENIASYMVSNPGRHYTYKSFDAMPVRPSRGKAACIAKIIPVKFLLCQENHCLISAFPFSSCSQEQRGAGNAATRRCLHLSPLALRPVGGANPVGRSQRRGTLKSPVG